MIERAGASPVHGGTRRHFDRFQIEASRPAYSGKEDAEKLIYFADDFLADRFGRFFSCGVSVSWMGRARQIFSLVSIKARLNS
jgi:hypothetical protein